MTHPLTAPRATTLLAHHAPQGFHYDWLIDPPAPDPPAGDNDLPLLWTARVVVPWPDWPAAGVVPGVALPPHRRRYLDWSGELSRGRGRVAVAARGHMHLTHWHDTRIEATLRTGTLVLKLLVSRPSPDAPEWTIAIS